MASAKKMTSAEKKIQEARLFLEWGLTGEIKQPADYASDAVQKKLYDAVKAIIDTHSSNTLSEKFALIVTKIRNIAHGLSGLDQKNDLIITLGQEISRAKAKAAEEDNKQILYAIEIFKGALPLTPKNILQDNPRQNWKNFLLGLAILPALKIHQQEMPVVTDTKTKQPKTLRAKTIVMPDAPTLAVENSYAVATTQFANKEEPTTSLDAAFNQYTTDQEGRINGAIIGIGNINTDGMKKAALTEPARGRIPYFTLKHLARLVATYRSPNKLAKKLPHLLDLTQQAVDAKTPEHLKDQGTSFAIARVWLQSDGTYQLVGASMGDCALYYYHPDDGKLTKLIGSQVYGEQNGTSPLTVKTAAFPRDIKKSGALVQVNTSFKAGGVIVSFSGGAMKILAPNLDETTAAKTETFGESNKAEKAITTKERLLTIQWSATKSVPLPKTADDCIKKIQGQLGLGIYADMRENQPHKQDYMLTGLSLPANPDEPARTIGKTIGKVLTYTAALFLAVVVGAAILTAGIALTLLAPAISPVLMLISALAVPVLLTAPQLLVANIVFWAAVATIATLVTAAITSTIAYVGVKIAADACKYDALPDEAFPAHVVPDTVPSKDKDAELTSTPVPSTPAPAATKPAKSKKPGKPKSTESTDKGDTEPLVPQTPTTPKAR